MQAASKAKLITFTVTWRRLEMSLCSKHIFHIQWVHSGNVMMSLLCFFAQLVSQQWLIMALLMEMKKRNTVTHNAASSCRLEIVSQLITLVVIHQSAAFSGKTLHFKFSYLIFRRRRGHIVLFYMTVFSQTVPTHRWRGGGGWGWWWGGVGACKSHQSFSLILLW